MTGYFVTDDDRGRILWRGTPDDHAPEYVAQRDDFFGNAFFDAAVLLLTEPDDALIERLAERACDLSLGSGEWAGLDEPLREAWRIETRAVLAALREEAGR